MRNYFRVPKTTDLGAVCGESRSHGSEAGRVPRGTDLCHFMACWGVASYTGPCALIDVWTRGLTDIATQAGDIHLGVVVFGSGTS